MSVAILPASRGVANVCKCPKDSHPVPDRRTGDLLRLWWRRLPLLRIPGTTAGTALPARTLSWEPPTSYIDATPMNPVTELDQFEIYVNETGTFTDKDVPTASLGAVDKQTRTITTSFNLANLSPHVTAGPKYYVSLRAVALTGLKSDFSPPVSFSF